MGKTATIKATIWRGLLAGTIAAAALAAAPRAEASLQLTIEAFNQHDNEVGAITITGFTMDGGDYVFSDDNLFGVFEIEIRISTNSPGTSSLAELLTVETSVREKGDGDLARNLLITVEDSGFEAPVGNSLTLHSQFEGTANQPNRAELISRVVEDNEILAALRHGLYLPGTGSVYSEEFSNLYTPFSLVNITYLEFNPNSEASTTSSTWVTATESGDTVPDVIPEPASVVVWGLLLACIAGGASLRRRSRPNVSGERPASAG